MAAYEGVLVEVTDHIGTATLNRPEKLNAFDPDACQDLLEALRMLAAADAVRVIVITGAGRAFCAGADLGVLGTQGEQLVRAGKDIALTIRNAPKPVLAAVNGPAAGGGANLALACDYRLASDQASIGQVFHKLGLGPDWGGSYFLPRLTGISKALELVWSARMVPAAEATQLGLFDRVVPHDTLAAETRALADRWAAMAPLAVRKAKAALYRSPHSTLEEMLDIEIADQQTLFATPEARQLIRNR
ncbi:MAG TPA: enoyl-CoA hydratase/isomerase family protein [Gemmatimonadales bacterium]|jgi:2-(1,2-epoxy-1,2-dihydrophenyl)acetyl-CoA isomerase|nr:enoyl-CoA hydratase/isomerase family protein [Gemmatimonadales bacterium]